MAEIAGAQGQAGSRALSRDAADTIYFGGGTPSLLEPEEIAPHHRRVRDAFDVAADREVTLEANPETVTEAGSPAFRAAGVNRLSFGVQSFRDEELAPAVAAAQRRPRARGVRRSARRGLRQHQPRSDDVAARAARRATGSSRSTRRSRSRPSICRSTCSRCIPNAPLKEEMARARWSQAPDEDAAAMYWRRWSGWRPPGYEQYEISNVARAGPPIAPQPEVLDRRRVARLRLRRALDARRRAMEECLGHEEYIDRIGARRVDGRRRPAPVAGRAAGRRAVHRAPAGRRDRPKCHTTSVRRGRLAPVRRRARAVRRGGLPATRRQPAQSDPPGNASCSRGHDGFRVAASLRVNRAPEFFRRLFYWAR